MAENQRKRRRQRPQLSCILCKRRKVKCDRELPCDQCYKLSKGRSCVYRDDLLPPSPGSDTVSPEPHVESLRNPTQFLSGLGAPSNLDQTRYKEGPALSRGQHQHGGDSVTPAHFGDAGTASVLGSISTNAQAPFLETPSRSPRNPGRAALTIMTGNASDAAAAILNGPLLINDDGRHGNLTFLDDEWATSFHGNSHWSSVFSQVRCIPFPSFQAYACLPFPVVEKR